jgi:hypothetical protein
MSCVRLGDVGPLAPGASRSRHARHPGGLLARHMADRDRAGPASGTRPRLSPVPGSDRAMPTGPTISPAISAAGRVLIPGRQTPGPREGAGGIASVKRQVSDHEWVLLADDGLRQRAPGSQRAARGRGERRQAEARNSAELLILNASYRPVDGFQDPRQARQGAGLAVSSAPGQGPQAQRGMPRLLSAVHPRGFTIGNRPSARSRAVSADMGGWTRFECRLAGRSEEVFLRATEPVNRWW